MTLPLHIIAQRMRPEGVVPLPDWSIDIGTRRTPPTEKEIVESFDHDTAIRFAYASQFLGKLLLRYIRRELLIPMRYRRLDFRKHCRELARCCDEFEQQIDRNFTDTTKAFLEARWIEWQENWHTDKAKLDYTTLNAMHHNHCGDTPHQDVAVGANIALAIIKTINNHGKYVASEVNKRTGSNGEFTPAPMVTLIQALVTDVAETLNAHFSPTQPMMLGIDIMLKSYLKLIKQHQWNKN